MGEITKDMDHGKHVINKYKTASTYSKADGLKEKGIDKNMCQQAEQIAKHPEILESVIENAQKRMGEITKMIPRKSNQYESAPFEEGAGKMETLRNKGISQAMYESAEQLAKHPEILDRVVENAKKGFKISGINTLFIK